MIKFEKESVVIQNGNLWMLLSWDGESQWGWN